MEDGQAQQEKPKKTTAKKLRGGCRRIFSFLLFILIAAAVLGYFIADVNYSQGEKSGYLINVSQKGFFFKTYEGVMRTQVLREEDPSATTQQQNWKFSIPNDSLYQLLLKYQGKPLRVEYVQKVKSMPWQGESDYFVSGIKAAE